MSFLYQKKKKITLTTIWYIFSLLYSCFILSFRRLGVLMFVHHHHHSRPYRRLSFVSFSALVVLINYCCWWLLALQHFSSSVVQNGIWKKVWYFLDEDLAIIIIHIPFFYDGKPLDFFFVSFWCLCMIL